MGSSDCSQNHNTKPKAKGLTDRLYNGWNQLIVTGIVAFCCPGIFNAINSLGGAGSSNAQTASFTNFCLYATFAIFGYTAGAFFNMLGPRVLMSVGASTYVFYILMSYFAAMQNSWADVAFIISGAVLGWGAGWFWSAQGALMLAYAPSGRKGFYISTFWVIFNLGGFIGGMMAFGVNFSNKNGTHLSSMSYFVFVGVMIAGTVFAVLGIRAPSKVTREDGKPVLLLPQRGVREELVGVVKVITDRNMLLLFTLFFASNFFYTYVFAVNLKLFTIRTRGLNSALFWGAQMVFSVLFGRLVDHNGGGKVRSTYSRAKAGFLFTAIVTIISWSMGVYLQYGYRGGFTRTGTVTKIDFASTEWIYPIITFILYGAADSLVQTFSYFIMSAIGGSDTQLCARYTGFYKGIQSLGAAVAWVLDSSYIQASYTIQLFACIGLFMIGMSLAWIVVRNLRYAESQSETDVEYEVEDDSIRKVYCTPQQRAEQV